MRTPQHLPFVGLDPRVKLQRLELAMSVLDAAARLHTNQGWIQFVEDMGRARQSHLESLAKADCDVSYERGVIAALDLVTGYRRVDPKQRAAMEAEAEGLRKMIASLHDADLLPRDIGAEDMP